jgi:AcrR family transcriptional regulator
MSEAPKIGLRERKKSAARQLIVQVSNRLFREHGFDSVTLEQIADECVLSVRTILRYFTTKEALALAPEHDAQDRFEATVRTRDTDAATCWREFVADTVQQMTIDTDESRRRMSDILSHPALHAEFLRIGRVYEDTLAEAIDEETQGRDPLGSRLYATVLVAGASATFREWIDNKDLELTVLLDVVDYAAEAFHPEHVTNVWSRRGSGGR